MKIAHKLSIALVAIIHFGFMALEMFFYNHPVGQKIFRVDASFTEATKTLMLNQGLYNGFLAAGLILSLIITNQQGSKLLSTFILSCIVVAGIVGAAAVSLNIFFYQSVPAFLALALSYLHREQQTYTA